MFYRGERVVLVWDGLSPNGAGHAGLAAEQGWLTLER